MVTLVIKVSVRNIMIIQSVKTKSLRLLLSYTSIRDKSLNIQLPFAAVSNKTCHRDCFIYVGIAL